MKRYMYIIWQVTTCIAPIIKLNFWYNGFILNSLSPLCTLGRKLNINERWSCNYAPYCIGRCMTVPCTILHWLVHDCIMYHSALVGPLLHFGPVTMVYLKSQTEVFTILMWLSIRLNFKLIILGKYTFYRVVLNWYSGPFARIRVTNKSSYATHRSHK